MPIPLAPSRSTAPGAVDVWLVPLKGDAQLRYDCLDANERARQLAFVRDVHQRRFGVHHRATREILAGYLGVTAGAVPITYGACVVCGGAHGKPFVASALALEFNVSRSHELGVVAVSGRPVGIDIEWLGRDLDVDLLAPDVLSPREIRALERSGHAARTQFFFRRWTAKEAALKAVGAGLTVPLTDVVIADRAGEVTFRLRQEDARPLVLVLKEIELNDKDYVVAVATHSPPPRVQLRSWPSDL